MSTEAKAAKAEPQNVQAKSLVTLIYSILFLFLFKQLRGGQTNQLPICFT